MTTFMRPPPAATFLAFHPKVGVGVLLLVVDVSRPFLEVIINSPPFPPLLKRFVVYSTAGQQHNCDWYGGLHHSDLQRSFG